jgi:hypothetical protein
MLFSILLHDIRLNKRNEKEKEKEVEEGKVLLEKQ